MECRRDWNLLVEATEQVRDLSPLEDLQTWMTFPEGVMLSEGDNVGIATFEYPGVYTCHWYFQSARGREAIDLGKRMVAEMFDKHGAVLIRGLIRRRLSASRWAIRQVGLKSYGFMPAVNGEDDELFMITKDEYLANFAKNEEQ